MITHALRHFPLHFIVPLSYRSAYIGEHGAKRVNGDESIVRSSVFDMLAPNRRSKVPIKPSIVPEKFENSARFDAFSGTMRAKLEPRSRAFHHRWLARRHIISSEASIRTIEARGLARDNDALRIRRPKSSYSVYTLRRDWIVGRLIPVKMVRFGQFYRRSFVTVRTGSRIGRGHATVKRRNVKKKKRSRAIVVALK